MLLSFSCELCPEQYRNECQAFFKNLTAKAVDFIEEYLVS